MPEASVEPPPSEPDLHPNPNPKVDSTRLVLIADPDEARGKKTAEAIRGWGLIPLLVHDGVEAMLAIQRMLPAAIVLDAGLPKMFGFQVCEVVKRNESLRHTRVVLVGAIHHQDRYRRDPSDLYGADVYVENPDLPDGLLPLLRDAGLSVEVVDDDGPISPTPSSEPTLELDFDSSADAVSRPEPESAPEESAEPEDPERTAERERAQRLARIAVSEMVLYQPEKFDQATRDGTLEQALDLEIQEARALLRQRIGEDVRAETDFIIDELNRVAEERGAQA
jgi:CheY-like chemotaxis protein